MSAYIYLNRFEEAKALAQTAISQKAAAPNIHTNLYIIALLEGDQAAAQRELAAVSGSDAEATTWLFTAAYQDALGKVKLARETSLKAVEVAKQHGQTELASNLTVQHALADSLHGFTDRARQEATEALGFSLNRHARGALAFAFAELGDTVQSRKILDSLVREFPDDTVIKYTVAPSVEAINLTRQNKAAEAITILEPSRKYEFDGRYAQYFSLYVRGIAYLQLKDAGKAAGEFQKILEHRGLNPIGPLYPLAQLNLARSYVLEGDNAKARTAYQDFFALWKDADPDIPVLLAAKSEYAKLP